MNRSAITAQAREKIVTRLQTDLMGPRTHDEALSARPADVYLTGILWPKNTAVAPEEDEKLAVGSGGEGESDDAEDRSQPHSAAMRRPSTAGISFAARAANGAIPAVNAYVYFGMYFPEEIKGKTHWKRVGFKLEPKTLNLSKGTYDVALEVGGRTGLRLNVRSVPFNDGSLATVTLVNGFTPEEKNRNAIEETTLFQVGLEIVPQEGTELISRPSRRAPVDQEDWSSALLYLDAREFAAGHTCSADWSISEDNKENKDGNIASSVRITWLPAAVIPAVGPNGHSLFSEIANEESGVLSASWLAEAKIDQLEAGLSKICEAYEKWIKIQETNSKNLSGKLVEAAERHVEEMRKVLFRMRAGIRFLTQSPDAASAFRLANLAMTRQREWSGKGALRWRPFQLGFLLLTIESTACRSHSDREIMDLLWFPTGGGKTEAYLGLVAYVAFYRRLSQKTPDEGAGVCAIMRYTLRLLTTQQFERASAMICACEAIRRGTIKSGEARALGTVPFSIGLWVGEDATPNTRKAAFESWTDSSKSSPRQFASCPCCKKALTYVQQAPQDSIEIFCKNESCILSGEEPLPVVTVDEDVYAVRPTLLIGTVDKFVQIVRNPRTRALLGGDTPAKPELIIQDELHLISGPLGTLSGLYESAIDMILSENGSRPKIIGSTATIRRAAEQVLALFDRSTCQFPPPGLSAEDSGFAVVAPDLPGRLYVGVTTAGRSTKFSLQAVSASLLQTSSAGLSSQEKDPFWTLIAYFNSLRELGGTLVLMQDDVHKAIRLIAMARNEAERTLRSVEELTSRRSQQEIREMLELLEKTEEDDSSLDVVLATNMVSVGVDISRLGLMVVNGQPKTMAEYIQATSRVGRGDISGLVIPLLNNAKPRDRSHYETFRTWHSTLYREVEATSVTPFASRARDRALHAVLVAVIRHLVPDMLQSPVLNDVTLARAGDLIRKIAERARRVDPLETDVEKELNERLARWVRRAPQQYWNDYNNTSLLQSAEEAAAKRAAGRMVGQAWPTPNTMRAVEPSTHFRLTERLRGGQ